MEIQRLGGVDGIRLRESRGALGDHDLVTDPKYCGNFLLMRINGIGSSIPIRSRYAKTEAVIAEILQGGIAYVIRDSSYVLSVMQLMLLMLVSKN